MLQKIISPKIGTIEYEKKDIIQFPDGLFGFEDYKQFLLVKNSGNDLFIFLQSVTEPELTFILVDPKNVYPDYELVIDEQSLSGMNKEYVWDFAIVTIPENPKEMMMNLMGPLLIDIKNQIGKQVISGKSEYGTRHQILKAKEKFAI